MTDDEFDRWFNGPWEERRVVWNPVRPNASRVVSQIACEAARDALRAWELRRDVLAQEHADAFAHMTQVRLDLLEATYQRAEALKTYLRAKMQCQEAK